MKEEDCKITFTILNNIILKNMQDTEVFEFLR